MCNSHCKLIHTPNLETAQKFTEGKMEKHKKSPVRTGILLSSEEENEWTLVMWMDSRKVVIKSARYKRGCTTQTHFLFGEQDFMQMTKKIFLK